MYKLFSSLLLLTLSACAYSPQQITINPSIDTDAESYGQGRSVNVTVEDVRQNKALGSRGGIYKETSIITLANDMGAAITRAAQAKLATQGFSVNAGESDASMKIMIEELLYDVPESNIGKQVNLRAVMSVEVAAGNESYTGRYRTNSERQTVVTPSMSKNEELINQLLSDTLVRLFSDPKLKAFLSNI